MNILRPIPTKIALYDLIPQIQMLTACELCREHNLVSPAARLHPLANPLLALAELVVYGCVDEVAALAVEVVEHGEGGFFGAFAESIFPGVTEVHAA